MLGIGDNVSGLCDGLSHNLIMATSPPISSSSSSLQPHTNSLILNNANLCTTTTNNYHIVQCQDLDKVPLLSFNIDSSQNIPLTSWSTVRTGVNNNMVNSCHQSNEQSHLDELSLFNDFFPEAVDNNAVSNLDSNVNLLPTSSPYITISNQNGFWFNNLQSSSQLLSQQQQQCQSSQSYYLPTSDNNNTCALNDLFDNLSVTANNVNNNNHNVFSIQEQMNLNANSSQFNFSTSGLLALQQPFTSSLSSPSSSMMSITFNTNDDNLALVQEEQSIQIEPAEVLIGQDRFLGPLSDYSVLNDEQQQQQSIDKHSLSFLNNEQSSFLPVSFNQCFSGTWTEVGEQKGLNVFVNENIQNQYQDKEKTVFSDVEEETNPQLKESKTIEEFYLPSKRSRRPSQKAIEAALSDFTCVRELNKVKFTKNKKQSPQLKCESVETQSVKLTKVKVKLITKFKSKPPKNMRGKFSTQSNISKQFQSQTVLKTDGNVCDDSLNEMLNEIKKETNHDQLSIVTPVTTGTGTSQLQPSSSSLWKLKLNTHNTKTMLAECKENACASQIHSSSYHPLNSAMAAAAAAAAVSNTSTSLSKTKRFRSSIRTIIVPPNDSLSSMDNCYECTPKESTLVSPPESSLSSYKNEFVSPMIKKENENENFVEQNDFLITKQHKIRGRSSVSKRATWYQSLSDERRAEYRRKAREYYYRTVKQYDEEKVKLLAMRASIKQESMRFM